MWSYNSSSHKAVTSPTSLMCREKQLNLWALKWTEVMRCDLIFSCHLGVTFLLLLRSFMVAIYSWMFISHEGLCKQPPLHGLRDSKPRLELTLCVKREWDLPSHLHAHAERTNSPPWHSSRAAGTADGVIISGRNRSHCDPIKTQIFFNITKQIVILLHVP